MDYRTFDPTADAQANYAHALAMMRLKDIIAGKRWATDHDQFDLVMAAALVNPRAPSRENGQ